MYSVSRCVRVCGISQLYVTIVTKRLCWCYFEAPNHSSCMFTYLAVGLIPDSYWPQVLIQHRAQDSVTESVVYGPETR